jgi:hypothetical protein
MSRLHIVGLPLSKDSVTDKFLNFISSDTPTLLITSVQFSMEGREINNDYITARVGYDLLFDHGFKMFPGSLVMPDVINKTIIGFPLWLSKDGRRHAKNVADDIIEIYKQLQQKFPNVNIAYITPGSPFLYDFVVKKIIKLVNNVEVIDTESSAIISYQHLLSYSDKIPKYRLKLIENPLNIKKLKKHHINIVGCLSSTYATNVEPLLNALSESDLIFSISVGHDIVVKEHTLSEFKKMIETNSTTLKFATFAFIKSTD